MKLSQRHGKLRGGRKTKQWRTRRVTETCRVRPQQLLTFRLTKLYVERQVTFSAATRAEFRRRRSTCEVWDSPNTPSAALPSAHCGRVLVTLCSRVSLVVDDLWMERGSYQELLSAVTLARFRHRPVECFLNVGKTPQRTGGGCA